MGKQQVLVYRLGSEALSKDLEHLNSVLQWHADGATEEETILELLHRNRYDCLVFSDEVGTTFVNMIKAIVEKFHPGLVVLRIPENEWWLMRSQVQGALSEGNAGAIEIKDSPFG